MQRLRQARFIPEASPAHRQSSCIPEGPSLAAKFDRFHSPVAASSDSTHNIRIQSPLIDSLRLFDGSLHHCDGFDRLRADVASDAPGRGSARVKTFVGHSSELMELQAGNNTDNHAALPHEVVLHGQIITPAQHKVGFCAHTWYILSCFLSHQFIAKFYCRAGRAAAVSVYDNSLTLSFQLCLRLQAGVLLLPVS